MPSIPDSELTKAYYLFNSATGQFVLEDLITRFDGPSFVPGGLEGQRMTEFNEGRRSVVRYIQGRMLEAVRKPHPHKEK